MDDAASGRGIPKASSRTASIARRVLRPEYVFRPSAAIRRLRLPAEPTDRSHPQRVDGVALPWSQTLTVFQDGLGRNVMATGVFDPIVTETIHRLLDVGGLTVDVGANVGYFTNLMATRAGPTGTVIAFEPHPVVFDVLSQNAARWNADHRLASVDPRCLAASDQGGEGWLTANTGPQQMGIAALRQAEQTSVRGDYEVEKATLDSLLDGHRLQLLKIDVEGHEHAVLHGAEALLSERRIRDVVFEDFETYPTPAMTLLEQHGMTVFTLDRSLFGLRVYPVSQGPAPRVWPGRNYLATLAPARALARLEPRGWRSLRPGRRERGPVRK